MEQIFCKTKPFSKNWSIIFYLKVLRLQMHHFHTKLHRRKSMVKTNRMGSTKWTYQKERGFASTYFIFFSVQEPLIKSLFDVKTIKMFIFILFESAGVLFEGALSLWVSLRAWVVHFVNGFIKGRKPTPSKSLFRILSTGETTQV